MMHNPDALINPDIDRLVPGFNTADRESWIQAMTRSTDNPVEEALHDHLTDDLFSEEISDSLRLLWKKLIPTVPARVGRILMRGPGLHRLDLGTAYEDTVAYRDYAVCMAEPEDQIYVPGPKTRQAKNGYEET